jgi:hypothetical protein
MTIAYAGYRNVLQLVVVIVLLGCEQQEPKQVVYPDQHSLPTPEHVFALGEWHIDSPSASLSGVEQFPPATSLQFQGELVLPGQPTHPGTVLVVFLKRLGNGSDLLGNLAVQPLVIRDERAAYVLTLLTPPEAGTYIVKVEWRDPSGVPHVIAEGQVAVVAAHP